MNRSNAPLMDKEYRNYVSAASQARSDTEQSGCWEDRRSGRLSNHKSFSQESRDTAGGFLLPAMHTEDELKQHKTANPNVDVPKRSVSPVKYAGPSSAWQAVLNLTAALENFSVEDFKKNQATKNCQVISNNFWPELRVRKFPCDLQNVATCAPSTDLRNVSADQVGSASVQPSEVQQGSRISSIKRVESSKVSLNENSEGIKNLEIQDTRQDKCVVNSQKTDVKEQRKLKHLKKKEEKRRRREEEFRKRLLAPKDQKVTVISKEIVEKMVGSNPTLVRSPPAVTPLEFPALGMRRHSIQFSELPCASSPDIPTVVQSASVKKPKRRDPITIHIMEAIKLNQQEKSADLPVPVDKKSDRIQYAGNPLDSTQPERKRGKHRENTSKKPSKLKTVILSERSLKKKTPLKKITIPKTRSHAWENDARKDDNSNIFDPTILKSEEVADSSFQNAVSLQQKPLEGLLAKESFHIAELQKVDTKKTDDLLDHSSQSEVSECPNSTTIAEPLMASEAGAETYIVVPRHEIERLHTNGSLVTHSRRFREYCDHSLTAHLNEAVTDLLKDIVRFHDAQFHRNPVKASARRRHVTGLREVRKQINLKKIKMLVVAPDLEKVQSKGGLDDQIEELKLMCSSQGIPYVFALNRRLLGKVLLKSVPVSCAGILNYEGTEVNFRAVMEALTQAQQLYKSLFKSPHAKKDPVDVDGATSDVNDQVVTSLLTKLREKETASDQLFLKAILAQND